MALRKLRKTLKPVIWVMAIAFLISIFLIGAGSAIGRKQPIAMKVNGKKIMIETVERSIYRNLDQQRQYYKEKVDKDYVKMMTINSVIENELVYQGAKKLHVGVSGKEVKEKYNEIIAQIGAKEAELRIREAMNLSVSQFKDLLKRDLIVQKTKEKIEDSYVPSEEEIKEEYENKKYSTYMDKTFDEAKEDVTEALKNQNKQTVYIKWIETAFANAKIEDVNSRYAEFMKKDVIKVGDANVDNINFIGTASYSVMLMGKTKKEAYNETIDQLKEEQALVIEAKKRGLKADENLPELMKGADFGKKLRKNIKANYKIEDEELKTYFEANKKKYETKEAAKAKYIQFDIKASDKDKETSKAKAEEILAEAMKDGADFAVLAKENSQGPTASKGGDLGWFAKGRMVPEFEEAAFKGEKGKVYPEVVKTRFGYHIIKVEDKKEDGSEVKASHILIKDEASDETKAEIKAKAEAVLADIKDGKKDFDTAVDENAGSKEEKEVNRGYVPNKEVNDSLFAMEVEEIKLVEAKNAYYILEKTAYTPYKEAVLEDVKDRVVFDFLNKKADEKIAELKKSLKDSVEVNVLDDSINAILNQEEKTEEVK